MGPSEDSWPEAVEALRARIDDIFERVRAWCEVEPALANFRPSPDAWSVNEVLEHLTLSHRFLLTLARKIRDKSKRRLEAGMEWPDGPPRFEHLRTLADREQHWDHPRHMTPTGDFHALSPRLEADREACLELADSLPPGAGTLHRIRMSVIEADDRLDLYQYLEVIVLHAERHLAQMERNRVAF